MKIIVNENDTRRAAVVAMEVIHVAIFEEEVLSKVKQI